MCDRYQENQNWKVKIIVFQMVITYNGGLTIMPNGTAVSFVGVIPTQGSASSWVLPGRNLSKATPRRVWRGFCHHDRRCEVYGSLLILNMFRGVSTVLIYVTSKRPVTNLYIAYVVLMAGNGLQKP